MQPLAVRPECQMWHPQRIKWAGASYVTQAWVKHQAYKRSHDDVQSQPPTLLIFQCSLIQLITSQKPTIASLQLPKMALPPVFDAILWVPLALLLWTLFSKLYQAYTSPLRDVKGPWLARFTRLWYAMSSYSRKSHEIHTDLHKKYGPIVRIAPNDYSIDDLEASKIIYRSRDPLVKVC